MLEELKQEVCTANRELAQSGLSERSVITCSIPG
jgi:ribulose-5-phosphate 4-epimerase/fuculose-1-phosphate aldolase